MNLPKISHPIFQITIPSTKKNINFRRFLASEEKILLMAKESDDRYDKLLAIKQVITNCVVDDFDIDSMATFDFDYVFMKLRANSVDNMVEVRYLDEEDQLEYALKIDLNEVKLVVPKTFKDVVNVGDIKIKLQYPTIGKMLSSIQLTREDNTFDLEDVLKEQCVKQIYDTENVYDEYTKQELIEWLGQLPLEANKQIKAFIASIPDLEYKTSYKTKAGTKREVELRGIEDFFTL